MRRPALALLLLGATLARAQDDLAPQLRAALVEIRVTSQSYDARSPWNKQPQRDWSGQGVMIQPGVVLTSSSVVQDQVMIEVSVANSARRYPARLKHVDGRVGLALVEITDPELVATMKPLPLGEPVRLDDEFDIYMLGQDNVLERSTARVVRADAQQTRLTLRLKTTCSDSGRGQVALRGGKVVGLLLSTVPSRQEGVLLSLETVRRYLADFDDGTYHGCPGPGMFIEPLLRDDLRTYYGVAPDQHGIVVTRVMPGRTGDGVVREGDVLLAVDGYPIDDEGKFTQEVHGRLAASYLFQGRRYAGDRIPLKILRGGQVLDVEVELKSLTDAEMLVPEGGSGARPEYLVAGGLVILELDRQLSRMIGRSPGGVILRRYGERAEWDPPKDRRRIVFVDRVYADPANKGFEDLSQTPLASVNGMPIREIADVAKALEASKDGFHVFQFEGVESDFVVPAGQLGEINARIAQTYRITRLRHLSGDPE